MTLLLLGGSAPRVRAYLYGALLYYLQIAHKHKPLHISITGVWLFVFIYFHTVKLGILELSGYWTYVMELWKKIASQMIGSQVWYYQFTKEKGIQWSVDLKLKTHSPDFGTERRRQKPAPISGLCVIPIWYQIFLVPDSGAERISGRPRPMHMTTTATGDWSMPLFSFCLYGLVIL